jgi:hypothetical protein
MVTIVPLADAYVEGATPNTGYGTTSRIVADGDPLREIFLRFDLSSVRESVQTVRLRLHLADTVDAGSPVGGSVARVDDTGWVEATVTYTTRPTTWGPIVAMLGTVTRNTWVEVDVTAAVRSAGIVTLGVRSPNTDGAYYDSRESGANSPQLVVARGAAAPVVTGTVIAAAGDTVCAPGAVSTATTCRHQSVSNVVAADASITAFLGLGDLQYENGDLAGFQSTYEASYGRFRSITKPVPGNHEYNTPGATGYYSYFGALAGDRTKGYYSFDIGSSWHIVALNSNCSVVSCVAGSTQEQWLRADLAASTRPCTVAFWHHPRFSSGSGHGNDTTVAPFWDALQQDGVELVLNGHEHVYERFAPQLPNGTADLNGIREIIVGTGGKEQTGFSAARPNSVVRLTGFAILKLTLGVSAYSWKLVSETGAVLDAGTGWCH